MDGIVRMVSGSQARRPARARFALAAALTVAFLVVFASFGGVAYATGAASKAASAVSKKAGGSDSKSGSTQGNSNNSNNGNDRDDKNRGRDHDDDDDDHGPAWHQYGKDRVTICHRSRLRPGAHARAPEGRCIRALAHPRARLARPVLS